MPKDRSDLLAARVLRRRATAATAGHRGDATTARTLLNDEAPTVRSAALGALMRLGELTVAEAHAGLTDPDPGVRRMAAEICVPGSLKDFLALLNDPVDGVVEAAAFALGERGDGRAVRRLCVVAGTHRDPLCRESAVAALGAIGNEAGRPILLAALEDITQIRRRAVIALAAFDGPDIDEALKLRLTDRDWQVRQAAEDLLGISDAEPR